MRVGVIRDWESRWFAEKEYGDLLQEDIKIRKYLFAKLKDAAVSRIELERKGTSDVEVIIRTARPGAIIGTNGETVEEIKKYLVKLTAGKKVNIKVVEIANPDLDAHIVARQIADQLEARASFRTAQKRAIQKTMRSGAKGIKTSVGGRLGGADIARSEGYSEGVVPLHTIRADIDFAVEKAKTTYGVLGVKVWICRGEVLPGEMVKEPEKPKGNPNGRPNRRRNDFNRRPNAERREDAAPAEAPAEKEVKEAAE
jgi:small subunit ribosomal protein S3